MNSCVSKINVHKLSSVRALTLRLAPPRPVIPQRSDPAPGRNARNLCRDRGVARDDAKAATLEVAHADLGDVAVWRWPLRRPEDQVRALRAPVEATVRRGVVHRDPEVRAPARAVVGARARVERVLALREGVDLLAQPVCQVDAERAEDNGEAPPPLGKGLQQAEEGGDDVPPRLRRGEAALAEHAAVPVAGLPRGQAQYGLEALARGSDTGHSAALTPQPLQLAVEVVASGSPPLEEVKIRNVASIARQDRWLKSVPDPPFSLAEPAVSCPPKHLAENPRDRVTLAGIAHNNRFVDIKVQD
mmetsp:Transcript_88895/g.251970  ORF Transcript_88895/g.251970 Transcript_88895/m.251970 type:complete len:302 (-) Transcript_88895:221-1126(-)